MTKAISDALECDDSTPESTTDRAFLNSYYPHRVENQNMRYAYPPRYSQYNRSQYYNRGYYRQGYQSNRGFYPQNYRARGRNRPPPHRGNFPRGNPNVRSWKRNNADLAVLAQAPDKNEANETEVNESTSQLTDLFC